jgi:hypothetical protein
LFRVFVSFPARFWANFISTGKFSIFPHVRKYSLNRWYQAQIYTEEEKAENQLFYLFAFWHLHCIFVYIGHWSFRMGAMMKV